MENILLLFNLFASISISSLHTPFPIKINYIYNLLSISDALTKVDRSWANPIFPLYKTVNFSDEVLIAKLMKSSLTPFINSIFGFLKFHLSSYLNSLEIPEQEK